MANWKFEKMKAELAAYKKAADAMQDDLNALRDIVFAVVKMYGRIRIPKEIVETLRTDDGVNIERQADGTVMLTLVAGVKEVEEPTKVVLS